MVLHEKKYRPSNAVHITPCFGPCWILAATPWFPTHRHRYCHPNRAGLQLPSSVHLYLFLRVNSDKLLFKIAGDRLDLLWSQTDQMWTSWTVSTSKSCAWAVSLWPQLYLCWIDGYTYTLIHLYRSDVVELLLLPHTVIVQHSNFRANWIFPISHCGC